MANRLTHSLGIMQGRLLPQYQGRYQAHPLGYWEKEFSIAASLSLTSIEFILDFNDAELNPLLSEQGIESILKTIDETGVAVKTVCADYFMEAPLHHTDEEVVNQSRQVLYRLLKNGNQLGITDIVIPCVDQSSLMNDSAKDRLVKELQPFLNQCEVFNINLSLETDLPPQSFAALINRFDSEHITVNYDTGNSAALGYDPVEEFECYGKKISDLHIKDRIFGGGSVKLGTGNTRFDLIARLVSEINYNGPIILQVYRDDEGIAIFKEQLSWLKKMFE